MMKQIEILDVFKQAAQDGIPSHFAVQYKKPDSVFVDYEYFDNLEDANQFATEHGYEL